MDIYAPSGFPCSPAVVSRKTCIPFPTNSKKTYVHLTFYLSSHYPTQTLE